MNPLLPTAVDVGWEMLTTIVLIVTSLAVISWGRYLTQVRDRRMWWWLAAIVLLPAIGPVAWLASTRRLRRA